MHWLDEPAPGTPVCLGFDGSDSDDWTVIRAETVNGFAFTPRYGPDSRPTLWNPREWDGWVPRAEVDLAVAALFDRFEVGRMYCDPPRWETDVDRRAGQYPDRVMAWPTYRTTQMHAALQRFLADLHAGRITHDGCPVTSGHMANAKKLARQGDRYILGKPSQTQKIDAAMGTVLAHEAAADARADGWGKKVDTTMWVF